MAATLLALELALARRDEASIPGGYEAVIAPDFTEIGSSGRLWTRAEILVSLAADAPNPSIAIESFKVAEIAGGVVLATYDVVGTTADGTRHHSHRSSIWIWLDGRWQLRFNQGTRVPDERT